MPVNLIDALSAIASTLRQHVARPDAHQYYPGGLRGNYVSCDHVTEVADRLDRVIHAAVPVERAHKAALVRDRDEWRGAAETWQAAHACTSQRCNDLERELDQVYAIDRESLFGTLMLMAEVEGLVQVLRDQEEALDHFSERLTRLNGELGTLLAELGEDPESLTQDELVPALRELIDLTAAPRPAPATPRRSFLARVFRRRSA